MQHQGPDDDVDSGDVEGDGGKNSANIFTFPSSSPSTSAAYASGRHNCMQEVAPWLYSSVHKDGPSMLEFISDILEHVFASFDLSDFC